MITLAAGYQVPLTAYYIAFFLCLAGLIYLGKKK